MSEPPFSDPLAWRPVKAPSLAEIEALAAAAFRRLPQRFRELCAKLLIRGEGFPGDRVIEGVGLAGGFVRPGLSPGAGLPFRTESAPTHMPNLIWLYRRPIPDYWAEHDETLGKIVTHVLLHEIGHHFGLSDPDIAAT